LTMMMPGGACWKATGNPQSSAYTLEDPTGLRYGSACLWPDRFFVPDAL